MANPAEDLVRHSAKKREDETNIPPKKIAQHHTAADIHAPASQNGDGYPLAGVQGGANSPLAIKNQSTFSTQPKNSKTGFFYDDVGKIEYFLKTLFQMQIIN